MLLIDVWEMSDSEMPIWGTHLKGTKYAANLHMGDV